MDVTVLQRCNTNDIGTVTVAGSTCRLLNVGGHVMIGTVTGIRRLQRRGVPRMEAKQAVRELLERLPDDCSLDDVLYHVYVLQAVQKGLADADAGRVIRHEEVAEALRRRWQLGAK